MRSHDGDDAQAHENKGELAGRASREGGASSLSLFPFAALLSLPLWRRCSRLRGALTGNQRSGYSARARTAGYARGRLRWVVHCRSVVGAGLLSLSRGGEGAAGWLFLATLISLVSTFWPPKTFSCISYMSPFFGGGSLSAPSLKSIILSQDNFRISEGCNPILCRIVRFYTIDFKTLLPCLANSISMSDSHLGLYLVQIF